MGRLTETRAAVLKLTAKKQGHHPIGPDWYAIYWLAENGLVESDGRARERRRYTITEAGRQALKEDAL